ncbi:MAG: signal peptidase II [Gemmatimonadota bacterium]|nr:signal peptidase II [Gemmatimonadota bacterium]
MSLDAREPESGKRTLFWSLVIAVIVLDIVTKRMALAALTPRFRALPVVGDWITLHLVYNRGAAFGLSLGPYSRWIFMVLTVVALFILARLYRAAQPGDRLRLMAVGLVCGGAVGNLLDRIPTNNGVVDFIDVGVGVHRWPTFNVADMAISCGALLLAWSLWGDDAPDEAAKSTVTTTTEEHVVVASPPADHLPDAPSTVDG